VHQPRSEPLEELPLAEHDDRLVAEPPGQVARPVDRLRPADEADEEDGAPREEAAARRRERRQPEPAGEDVYEPRAFLSSALIAGTIACRSPMTA
jgi:hypothetical protein